MDNSESFAYYNPVRIHFAPGAYLQALKDILDTQSVRIGLFYGQSAMRELGAIDAIRTALPDCQIWEHGNITPNPDVRDVEAVLKKLPGVDWVIGIGGGSVLDLAKSVAFTSCQKENWHAFLAHENTKPPIPGLPFIAIPTTSGTGSEVTPWATLWDGENRKKYSLSNVLIYPDYAIVDPFLTLSLSPYVTAYTAFDALSHALEAFWSRFANPISDLYAVEAIQLVLRHLEPVMTDLSNLVHRTELARASLYAGMAFSNTKTTAVHAISYPMTLHYGVPHGVACALTLPEFWRYNLETIEAGKTARLLSVVELNSPYEFVDRIESIRQEVGLPCTLRAADIPQEGIEVILNEGFHPERVVNSPRHLTRDDLRNILERIYG